MSQCLYNILKQCWRRLNRWYTYFLTILCFVYGSVNIVTHIVCVFQKEKEIEMEDADKEEEPVIDIDACDKNNPLAAVEYIHDMHTFYKNFEVNLSCFTSTFAFVFFIIERIVVSKPCTYV